LTLGGTTQERWWEVESYRLKGVSLLQLQNPGVYQAKGYFQQTLDVARGQQAKALKIWAAVRLSRLWQRQGKREATRTLLAPPYGWLTGGSDTLDLQEAKGLLAELL
jgi:predicted ATPase